MTSAPIRTNSSARRASERAAWGRALVPIAVLVTTVLAWEIWVRWARIPHYLVPAPSLVLRTVFADAASLWPAWGFTLRLTAAALALATAGGVLIAAAFASSRAVERALLPFAVALQVTPIIAIAPLVLIYVDDTFAALLVCAWIVAFFPILSNTLIGLRSADRHLSELFTLYHASRWQRLRLLLAPSALPYFLSGLRVAAGLSLIGAVAAEFVAGAAGVNTGLASRMLEAQFRGEVPRMFAALTLISLTGVMIHLASGWLSRRLLAPWHDSERSAD